MAKIGLVISDIDGTILDQNHQLDSRLKENLVILNQQGIPFCLASARSPLGIRPIQEELGLEAPLVAYNGALIGQWQEGEFRVLQEQDFPETSFYLSKVNYLEITHRSVSKGHALSLLADIHGLSMEETLAFGDHFNDLSMLKAAGVGVAMGNAPQAVREAADAVTADNHHNGVSLYLERVLLSETR